MSSTFNPHTIDRLSASEIVQILSSNIFIAGSNRKKLEERLFYLQNQQINRVDKLDKQNGLGSDQNKDKGFISRRGKHSYSSDSFRIRTKKPEEKDIPKKIIQEDFPILNNIAKEEKDRIGTYHITQSATSSTIVPKTRAPLNFKKIIDDRIINNNYDQDSTELFIENDLVVNYKEIEKIYKLYAIDRIHLLYLDLSRKINILNQADSETKKLFNYDELCIQKEIMRYCSYAYIQIKQIITLSESCIKILNSWGQNEAKDKIDELQELIPKMQYISNPKFNTFIKDFNYIKRTFKEFWNTQNRIDLLEIIINKSNELLVFLTETFDPVIDCEYHIEFKRKSEGNITPVGISSYGYHNFRDITMKLYEEETILDILNDKRINYLFNQSYLSQSGIILIRSPIEPSWNFPAKLPISQNICLRFTIADDIPFAKGGIIVKNKPEGSNILTTFITNPKLLPEFKEKFPICSSPNSINRWFSTRNKSFILTEEEYCGLPDNIKLSYDLEDCDKNIFYVDTLFSQLLEYDGGDGIIEPHMLDSFRKLSYNMS